MNPSQNASPTPTPSNAPTPTAHSAPPRAAEERFVKTFHDSKWRIGFWLKTIFTLSIWYWVVYRHNRIDLTTIKVSQRRGSIFTNNETSLYISDIRDITLNQSFLGRLLNYGDLGISSAGSSGSEISMIGIGGAGELRALLFDLRDGKLDDPKLQKYLHT
jgi:uncharacterized membrane protein YdbT with pleckstrin-like domain